MSYPVVMSLPFCELNSIEISNAGMAMLQINVLVTSGVAL